MSKKTVIAYDIAASPHGLSAEQMLFIRQQHGLVFYDSNNGQAPTVLEASPEDELKFVDTATKEGRELLMEKQ
jgi:hypothetical protein